MSQRTSRPYLGYQLESRYHSVNETIIASAEDAYIAKVFEGVGDRHIQSFFFLSFFFIPPSLST